MQRLFNPLTLLLVLTLNGNCHAIEDQPKPAKDQNAATLDAKRSSGNPKVDQILDRLESKGQRIGCAIACATIFSVIGIPICGILANELSVPMHLALLGQAGFTTVGGWLGYRR